MSKPIVVIVCMVRSSESWEPQQRPHPWHRCAGGGAVHSIKSGSGAFLFKNLVRASEKRRRDFETEQFCRLEIDGKQEFRGLLDRKVGRFSAFENSIDIVGTAPRQNEVVRTVRNQSARLHKLAGGRQVDRRQPCLRRKIGHSVRRGG